MKLFAFARSKPENSLKYFASKVYFSSLKVLDKPTFAFLHENDKMGIPQVFRLLRKKAPRYFFVIVNGQQIPTFDSNPERDRLFGRSLTGIHRVLEKGIWRGKCLVHAGPHFPSVAATLWREYQDSAMVLDILNPKYEWQDLANENKKPLLYTIKLISDMIKVINKARLSLPQFIIMGYSRGGVFALRLTRHLKAIVPINAVLTIDPVISEISEADSLCVGWGLKEKTGWKIIWKEKLAGIHLSADSFPILENPAVPCYNVFQRKSFWALNSILEKPIGSAVHGATPPGGEGSWEMRPLAARSPFDQYDVSMDKHSAMLEKYSGWALDVARRACPL